MCARWRRLRDSHPSMPIHDIPCQVIQVTGVTAGASSDSAPSMRSHVVILLLVRLL
jgi:hypothetical protein